jgi:putative pyruvate formate lyase activating enzyme
MFSKQEISHLSSCQLCPRNCKANRFSGKLGYCNSDAGFHISSICVHRGEEPVISGKKGICNVFFPHCNLQCVYCQNHDISRNKGVIFAERFSFEEIIQRICSTLDITENVVGFVSPSHYIPQMAAIIRGIHNAGRKPVIVYNTNGYDNVSSLRMLDGMIDVYLPDFKYMDAVLAFKYSQARNYPKVASAALKEMYRQKGSTLIVNDDGIAESGIIVRHLVLPGAVSQSIDVLRFISEELSPKLHVSLMSQYYPTQFVSQYQNLDRTITSEEYNQVVDAFHELGFYRGWVQDLESQASYRPDFFNDDPFGGKI